MNQRRLGNLGLGDLGRPKTGNKDKARYQLLSTRPCTPQLPPLLKKALPSVRGWIAIILGHFYRLLYGDFFFWDQVVRRFLHWLPHRF